jgi:putative tricarboxylic transport membrane protein
MLMRRFDFPGGAGDRRHAAGPMAEKRLRNALSIGEGDWTIFLTQPIAVFFMSLTLLVLVVPYKLHKRGIKLHEDD